LNIDLSSLTTHILEQGLRANKNATGARTLVAIAGPPGAGKSTLAAELCPVINDAGTRCCVVPMDGFHLDNRVLTELGLLNRKGSVQTFDANGFVQCVKRIHSSRTEVVVPMFDRALDKAIAGAKRIMPNDEIVLVEGNYLLINDDPWQEINDVFDVKLFINPGLQVIEQRILERWNVAQLNQQEIQAKTYENDLPNAKYVLEHSDTTEAIQLDSTFILK